MLGEFESNVAKPILYSMLEVEPQFIKQKHGLVYNYNISLKPHIKQQNKIFTANIVTKQLSSSKS